MSTMKSPMTRSRERIAWAKTNLQQAAAANNGDVESLKKQLAREICGAQMAWLSVKEVAWYLRYQESQIAPKEEEPAPQQKTKPKRSRKQAETQQEAA